MLSLSSRPAVSPGSLTEAALRHLDAGVPPARLARDLHTTTAHLAILLPDLDLSSVGGGWHVADGALEVAALDAIALGEESTTAIARRLGLPVEHVQRLRRLP